MTRPLSAAAITFLVAAISWIASAGESWHDPVALAPLPDAAPQQGPRPKSQLAAPDPAPEPRAAVVPGEDVSKADGAPGVAASQAADVGAAVEVRVVDASGAPVPGVSVCHRADGGPGDRLDEAPARPAPRPDSDPLDFPDPPRISTRKTDDEGRAWFRELEPGPHSFQLLGERVRATPCLTWRNLSSERSPWMRVELASGDERGVELSTEPIAWIEGRLTELGIPLAGARLRLDPGLGGGFWDVQAAVTDEEGWYRFESVEAGSYDLVVEDDRRVLPVVHQVTALTTGTRFDIDLDVSVVEGRVTDEWGNPVAGARVTVRLARYEVGQLFPRISLSALEIGGGAQMALGGLTGSGGFSLTTGADGRFRLRGVPSGVGLLLHARGGAFCPSASRALELGPNESRFGVDFVLRPGASLTVRVIDERGEPAGNGVVLLRMIGHPGKGDQFVGLDSEGRARIQGLEPGRWSVRGGMALGMRDQEHAQVLLLGVGDQGEVVIIAQQAQGSPEPMWFIPQGLEVEPGGAFIFGSAGTPR